MQVGLRQPQTPDEAKEHSTVAGMRKAIQRAEKDSDLVRLCLEHAGWNGMSPEETYVLLAYFALLSLENLYQQTQGAPARFVRLPGAVGIREAEATS